MGSPELIDCFDAFYVKILNHKKVLDVGCGDRFTVVLAIDPKIKLPSLAQQNFNQKNFSQIKNKVKVLKEFAKKKEELNNRPEHINPLLIDFKKIDFSKMKRKGTFDGKNLDLKNDENQRLNTDSIVDERRSSYRGNSLQEANSSLLRIASQNVKSDLFLDISQKLLSEIHHLKSQKEIKLKTEGTENLSNQIQNLEISDERGKNQKHFNFSFPFSFNS